MLLSPKEKEVLKWIVQGKCSSHIGSLMGITERTVKYHVGNILRKLHAENRAHAAVIAVEKGLLKKTRLSKNGTGS